MYKVLGDGREGSSGETSADLGPNRTYVQGTKEKIEGLHVQSSLPSQSGRNIGYLGKNSIRITCRKKKVNIILNKYVLVKKIKWIYVQ